MNNFVQPGLSLNYTHTAVVAGGAAILIGTVLVIPATSAGVGTPFAGWIEGVFNLPCATGTAWTMHVPLYWDDANKRVTTTANGNTKIGMAAAPKIAADPSGPVKLLPTV